MKKNVASQSIGAQMITAADGTNFTGSVSVLVTVDNGTQNSGGGTAPAHEGNGYHSYTPTQAETNGDHIAFTFTGTGAITSTVQLFTSYPQTVDNNTILATLPTQTYLDGRTLATADYFDPAADTVANVTTVATTTDLTNLPAIPTNWLTATGIAASALDGKGDWNIGKTGYALTQAFPTNFADLSITASTGLMDITQVAADKAWSTTTRALTDKANFTISGTKTTLDALNDIAATDIVSSGAINTTAGAVDNVTLVATTTTNTDMRGTDSALLASSAPTNFGSMSISGTGDVNADVKKMNAATLLGNGTSGNLWRGS
jgi:hypothetical protein